MAGKVLELKKQYGEEQARIVNEIATLAAQAGQRTMPMDAGTREALGREDYSRVLAAEQAAWAQLRREELKERYVGLDLERTAAIEEARLEAERELSPQDVSAEAVLMATSKSEQELIDSMDAARTLGVAGEETIKLCFAMARQKEDYELAIQHALTIMPELEGAYEDIILASQEPELGPEDTFEMFADPAPSKHDLLISGPQLDINLYPQMR
jgi:hypothetical protein